jgi:hypothetical protein
MLNTEFKTPSQQAKKTEVGPNIVNNIGVFKIVSSKAKTLGSIKESLVTNSKLKDNI